MKRTLSILALFLISILNTHADYWTQKADHPGPGKELPISFSIGTKGYAGCGTGLDDFWEYDPATNMWTQKANVPGGVRRAGVGFSIGNKGYACTGEANGPELYEYDPGTNAWTQKATFPGGARSFASAFTIGNKGYLGTGQSPNFNDLWEYDPSVDTWTKKKSLLTGRAHTVGFAVNGKGYFSTGCCYVKDTWEYDPVSDTWTQKADFPGAARSDATGFAICNMGYLGTGGETPYYVDFYKFDPIKNIWVRKADIPSQLRDDCAGFSIGNKGYIGLGQFLGTTDALDLWEYTPDSVSACLNLPTCNFQVSDSTLCANDCVHFTDKSLNASSWSWTFNGGTPSSGTDENPNVCYKSSGTYDVTLVASNPGGSDSLTFTGYIHVNPAPPTPIITQVGTTLYCSTDPTYSSYQWYDSATLIPGATDTSLVINKDGNYNVSVSNEYGCSIAVGINVKIDDIQALMTNILQFKINTNPVNNVLKITGDWQPGSRSIMIFTAQGKRVSCSSLSFGNEHDEADFDVSDLSSGIYFVQIGSSWVGRFVKE